VAASPALEINYRDEVNQLTADAEKLNNSTFIQTTEPETVPQPDNAENLLDLEYEPLEDLVVGPTEKHPRPTNHKTVAPRERALLVGVGQNGDLFEVQDSLDELEQLCDTAGLEIVGRSYQNIGKPHRSFLIGTGKVEELKRMCRELEVEVVVFDRELTPTQTRELEEAFGIKLLDRTGIILDIFASRARTHEGRLQVELAQLEYRLPRLTRLWTHLSRQTSGGRSAGGVGVRGPGETQLEVDRRSSKTRVSHLKRELENVHTHRELYRRRRKLEGIPVVSLVGYTNAGKSTLLNKLANADVYVENKLFATLDPTTRRIKLPNGREILLTDTVGFIQRLPTGLVEAFRSTLEEVNEADLLIHVLDFTHPNAQEQSETVGKVLKELGAEDKPQIIALNKIDRYRGEEGGIVSPEELSKEFELPEEYVPVSASYGIGMDLLLARIEAALDKGLAEIETLVPYGKEELVALFHQKGFIETEEHQEGGTYLKGRIPPRYEAQFADYPAGKNRQKAS
jgi:GTP-binding protein HflX